ncbi:Metal binding domain-containing protein [Cladophialophora immunda]|nr:Metal binding domain-containing protein [Cladophialophora immunda]
MTEMDKHKSIKMIATRVNVKTRRFPRVLQCQRPSSRDSKADRPLKMSAPAFSNTKARWSAVVSRNPDAVGEFVYAVKTTGIYCRPDCKARLARRANIVFYDSGPLAEEAGYRACKRCKPNLLVSQEEDPLLAKIRHAVDLVKTTASQGQKISLQQLSCQVRLSKWHLQRVFKRLQGLSPHEMSNAIISAIEGGTEESPQPAKSQPENLVQSGTGCHLPEIDPRIGSSRSAQGDAAFTQDGLLQYDNREVDDVLRDLFPELYTEEAEREAGTSERA